LYHALVVRLRRGGSVGVLRETRELAVEGVVAAEDAVVEQPAVQGAHVVSELHIARSRRARPASAWLLLRALREAVEHGAGEHRGVVGGPVGMLLVTVHATAQIVGLILFTDVVATGDRERFRGVLIGIAHIAALSP